LRTTDCAKAPEFFITLRLILITERRI
jgi:hypothetical protein